MVCLTGSYDIMRTIMMFVNLFYFNILLLLTFILIINFQWLCYADKSSHEPRLRLKYVLFMKACLC